jgi:hypothetical protein
MGSGPARLRVWCAMSFFDHDAVVALADLVGRTGAREFEIGWVHDDVPSEEAGWYATAKFKGARITEEGAGPTEAADALSRRLLTGARCKCRKLVALSDYGAVAYSDVKMADGSTWSEAEARTRPVQVAPHGRPMEAKR